MPDFVDDGGEAVIEDSTFSNNGVSVWRGFIQIRNSGFFFRWPRLRPAFGGALILRGNATIEKTEFLNNRAPNGAAVWFASGELALRRATFEGNIATGIGGALGVSSADAPAKVSIRYSHFRRNRRFQGGAIAFRHRCPAYLGENVAWVRRQFREQRRQPKRGRDRCAKRRHRPFERVQIVGNQAAGIGGAINGGGDFNLTRLANALVVRNTAATGGAYTGLRLELINATVAENEGRPAIALLADVSATAKFTNTIFLRNAGGSCMSLPGGEVATFADGGHNVQFPTNDCGASVPVVDPRLDSMYVPVPNSPVRFAGDTPVCLAAPINGRDIFNDPRPRARGQCTIGAIESTIEPFALRALCHTDAPGKLADLLELVCSVAQGRGKERPDDRKAR